LGEILPARIWAGRIEECKRIAAVMKTADRLTTKRSEGIVKFSYLISHEMKKGGSSE
jgi:hypothetical protein